MTHSLYIPDPDGNEIELYIDVPGVDWRNDPGLIMSPVKQLTTLSAASNRRPGSAGLQNNPEDRPTSACLSYPKASHFASVAGEGWIPAPPSARPTRHPLCPGWGGAWVPGVALCAVGLACGCLARYRDDDRAVTQGRPAMSREQPATTAVKLLYRPFALVFGTAGGLIAARVFREVWMRDRPPTIACRPPPPSSRSSTRGRSWWRLRYRVPCSDSSKPASTARGRGPSSVGRVSGRGSEAAAPALVGVIRPHAHTRWSRLGAFIARTPSPASSTARSRTA